MIQVSVCLVVVILGLLPLPPVDTHPHTFPLCHQNDLSPNDERDCPFEQSISDSFCSLFWILLQFTFSFLSSSLFGPLDLTITTSPSLSQSAGFPILQPTWNSLSPSTLAINSSTFFLVKFYRLFFAIIAYHCLPLSSYLRLWFGHQVSSVLATRSIRQPTLTMAQPREIFHPSSPPSEGGADSYNHEGTPDTRLSIFSPLEDSSKSSRLLSALSLSGGKTSTHPIKFQVPNGIHQVTSPESFISSEGQDRDPFISSTPEKSQTKLSATASAFRPLAASVPSTPIIAYGSSSATPKVLARSLAADTICPKTGLKLAPDLSHNLELTRSLRISSSAGPVTIAAIEQYLKVSSLF